MAARSTGNAAPFLPAAASWPQLRGPSWRGPDYPAHPVASASTASHTGGPFALFTCCGRWACKPQGRHRCIRMRLKAWSLWHLPLPHRANKNKRARLDFTCHRCLLQAHPNQDCRQPGARHGTAHPLYANAPVPAGQRSAGSCWPCHEGDPTNWLTLPGAVKPAREWACRRQQCLQRGGRWAALQDRGGRGRRGYPSRARAGS